MVDKLGDKKVAELVKKMGGSNLGTLVKNNGVDTIAKTLQNYDEIAGLPGAKNLMNDLLAGGNTSKGAIGEIQYAAQLHRNGVEIKQLGDVIGGKKAADIVLKDGKIIDVKNYTWSSYKNKNGTWHESLINRKITEMTKQVTRRRGEYGNVPIRYAFIGSLNDAPPQLIKALEKLGVEVIGIP